MVKLLLPTQEHKELLMSALRHTLTFEGDENPFKVLRNSLNLSQYKLANRISVSKHAILRNEQGMYAEPLPAVMAWFEHNCSVGRVELLNQYEIFQKSVRERSGKLLGPIDSDRLTHATVPHPFTFLRIRAGFNVTSLSKNLCLNQSVVNYFERSPINQRTIPEQLVLALKDAGYSDTELDCLAKFYADYREHILGIQDFKVVTND